MALRRYRKEAIDSIYECVRRVGGDAGNVLRQGDRETGEFLSYIENITEIKKLENIKESFYDIGKGMQTLKSSPTLVNPKTALAIFQVIAASGQVVAMHVCPGVKPLFTVATSALGFLTKKETNTEMVVERVVGEAFERYEDKTFQLDMHGVFNEFRNDMAYLQESHGSKDIMMHHAVNFLGKIEGKIHSLKKDSINKENKMYMLEAAKKVLTYIEMYCLTACHRLIILYQLQLQSENRGIEDKGLRDVINRQRRSMKQLFECITDPTEHDAVVMAAFSPSKHESLAFMIRKLNLKFQRLSSVESFHYMKNDCGLYFQAGSGHLVYTCKEEKLAKVGKKTRLTFKQIGPAEDNMFVITSSLHSENFYMQTETSTVASYVRSNPLVRFEEERMELNLKKTKHAIIKIVRLRNGYYILSTLASPSCFMAVHGDPKEDRQALNFTPGLEEKGSQWQFLESI